MEGGRQRKEGFVGPSERDRNKRGGDWVLSKGTKEESSSSKGRTEGDKIGGK